MGNIIKFSVLVEGKVGIDDIKKNYVIIRGDVETSDVTVLKGIEALTFTKDLHDLIKKYQENE